MDEVIHESRGWYYCSEDEHEKWKMNIILLGDDIVFLAVQKGFLKNW